jgi:hypothetical protein
VTGAADLTDLGFTSLPFRSPIIQRPSFGGNWGRSGMGRMFLRRKGGPAGKGDSGTESQGTYDMISTGSMISESILKSTYWSIEDTLGIWHDLLRFPSRRRRRNAVSRVWLLHGKDGVRIMHLRLKWRWDRGRHG